MAGNSSLFVKGEGGNLANSALLAGLGWVERVSGLAAGVEAASDGEVEELGLALIRELGKGGDGKGEVGGGSVGWLGRLRERFGREDVLGARERGVRALVRVWGRLGLGVRREGMGVMGVMGGAEGIAVEVAAEARAELRESAVRFAADSGRPELFGVVCGAVVDDEPRVGAVGEEMLAAVAARVMGLAASELEHKVVYELVGGGEGASAEVRGLLREHVAGLCAAFGEHRRKGVLVAAMALLEPGAVLEGALGEWLGDERSAGLPAMRAMMRRGGGAVSRRRAWEWMMRGVMAGAAEDRLMRAETVREKEVVLEGAHLLENPRRAARVGELAMRPGGSMKIEAGTRLGVGARRGLARWVGAVSAGRVDRERAALLTDEDEVVRLSAVRAAAGGGVLDFCFDGNEAVACAASVKWWGLQGVSRVERERTARNLARSPHARVRATGERYVRYLMRKGGGGGIGAIREELMSHDSEVVVGAIAAAQRSGLAGELAGELAMLTQAGEGWERVVASAVSALGEVVRGGDVGDGLAAVESCLGHGDARVRANAAEAMALRLRGRGDVAGQSPRLYDRLIELKGDASHRVRSSVVRAVLRAASPEWGGTGFEPTAAEELVRMLEDERPMHRLAGLWAVEHVPLGESLERRWDRIESLVAGLVREEADDAVQRRAVWCARRLLGRGADMKEAVQ